MVGKDEDNKKTEGRNVFEKQERHWGWYYFLTGLGLICAQLEENAITTCEKVDTLFRKI